MSTYKQTLALLDGLIAKLAANTGGEPLLPSETTPPKATQPVIEKQAVVQ
jgi:aminoacyl tRNA synthase complex-interacting multifunctional protein 1